MKVSFENPDKVNGLLTITVEEEDFKNDVEKKLKDYRKRANINGFRPGNAPMGLIKKQFGMSAKMDTVNKVVSDALNKYIQDNKIEMLGRPLASEKQEPVDIEKEAPYTFMFDIAVAPEFDIQLSDKDKIDYYDIKVDDALIDRQVMAFARNYGHRDNTVKEYDATANDILKGDLREQTENGIVESGVSLMPQYIKADDQKKLFDGAKLGDVITFNPRKAYPDNDAEVKSLLRLKEEDDVNAHTGDFTFQITEISRFVPAEVNQELFDDVYGKDTVKSEKEFREKIKNGLAQQLQGDQNFQFLQDLRAYAEKKVGDLTFPDALLKRMLMENVKQDENNKEKPEDVVNRNYESSIKALRWDLIRNKIAIANEVKVNDDDVRVVAVDTARAQFAQYGMTNLPDEYLQNYLKDMLKRQDYVEACANRALDMKLAEKMKTVVTLNHKEVNIDDFNKMIEEKNK
ncbi:MAG: trigger factor [Prevotella sp.]|jgi:trigger factor